MNMLKDLELNESNQEKLGFLVRSIEDYDLFVRSFWRGAKEQIFSIADFRSYKIAQRNLGSLEFQMMYNENPKLALEELFQQPVDDIIASAIINKVLNKEMSITAIYDTFSERKGLNVSRLAHGRR